MDEPPMSTVSSESIGHSFSNVTAAMMELFDKSYYKLTKVMLSFLGQWPLQSVCKKLIIRILIASFLLSIAIPEVIKLVSVLDDLEIVVECIPPLGLHVLNAMKCITTSYHADKLLTLMAHMDLDWKTRVGGDGSDVLHEYAARGRILSTGYAFYMLVGGTLYVCAPLMPLILDIVQPLNETRPREFLFRTEFFINQNDYFVPIFLHALLTTSVSMVIVSACDTLYGAFVHYASATFVELGELEMPHLDVEQNFYISKDNDHIYHHVRKCAERHKKAIEFCDLLESTYTAYFFGVIGTNIFLISFTGVQTVMKLDDPNLLIRYGIYVFGQVMHAFFLCWHGQLLKDHSEEIAFAVYKCRWHDSSSRTRRLLTLMMIRSGQPCILTAGKIFPVTLETFTTIIKTAMSYFTVLKSLQ